MSMITDIKVAEAGHLVITKRILEKYGIKEDDRILVCGFGSQILLIPINKYEKPTEALYGSVKTEKGIDEPKEVARKHMRRKLVEEFV